MKRSLAARKSRSSWTRLFVAFLLILASASQSVGGTTLRIAYPVVPEGLDPARAPDVGSQAIAGTLFDQLYAYDYLARPVRVIPLAAADMPTVSVDGREMTIRIRPGIRFAPHPTFHDSPRELTANDFIYSVKRFMDPAVRSPIASLIQGKIEGLDDLALHAHTSARFDYDTPVAGLVAVDRYTLRIRLTRPDPVFIRLLANPDLSIVPREAVEASGNDFARNPIGSGPYMARKFDPGNRLVLERNPNYRDRRWEDVASSTPDEPAWAARFRHKRIPLPDRVELVAIPEATTRLLALERGEIDVLYGPPPGVIENKRRVSRLATFNLLAIQAQRDRAAA